MSAMVATQSKLSQVRSALHLGDYCGALRIAARFPRLGEHRTRITRGWAALQNPHTYEEMGYDPDTLVADAVRALHERFDG